MGLSDYSSGKIMDNKPRYEPLPEGTYRVAVAAAEWKSFDNGEQYLSVTLKCMEGEYKGCVLFHSFMVNAESDGKRDYAQSKFAQMLFALGYADLNANPNLKEQGYKSHKLVDSPADLAKVQRRMDVVWHDNSYNGKSRMEVKYFNAIKSAPTSQPSGGYATTGSDLGDAEPLPNEKSVHGAPSGSDEDVPF